MIDILKIIKDLKNYLVKHYGNDVKEVILFGSHAVAEANADSDIDVLIVLDKPHSKEDENRLLDLCYEIDLKYNILLEIHLLSKPELNALRGKQPIYYSAIQHGVYA